MSDTASPDGGVVYHRDRRPTEPDPSSVNDTFALWWALFRMMWLASVEMAEACQRETLRGLGGTVR